MKFWLSFLEEAVMLGPLGNRLGESLAWSMFIKECPWDQHLWKGGGKVRCDAVPRTVSVTSQGSLEIECPFRIVPRRAERARTLYRHIYQSLEVGGPGRSVNLDEATLCR